MLGRWLQREIWGGTVALRGRRVLHIRIWDVG